jgi:hypothetical protein
MEEFQGARPIANEQRELAFVRPTPPHLPIFRPHPALGASPGLLSFRAHRPFEHIREPKVTALGREPIEGTSFVLRAGYQVHVDHGLRYLYGLERVYT